MWVVVAYVTATGASLGSLMGTEEACRQRFEKWKAKAEPGMTVELRAKGEVIERKDG